MTLCGGAPGEPARPVEDVFTEIFRTNAFGGSESVSGPGSSVAYTAPLRAGLEALVRDLGVRSMLDAPCGDFNWMKEAALDLDEYIGVDIVAELVARNQARYGNAVRRFLHRDILRDSLPRADLVFSRDCLDHLPLADCLTALRNFKRSGSRWLVATHYVARDLNVDIVRGSWRPLDYTKAPFGFPAPLRLIDEQNRRLGGIYSDKRQALWELATLSLD